MEGEEEAQTLSKPKRARKSQVNTKLERVKLLEDISWRQKSRALWLKEGDKCTNFYRVDNCCRRNNVIDMLMVDGAVPSDQSVIKNYLVQYHQHLPSEQHLATKSRWLDFLSFRSVVCRVAEEAF